MNRRASNSSKERCHVLDLARYIASQTLAVVLQRFGCPVQYDVIVRCLHVTASPSSCSLFGAWVSTERAPKPCSSSSSGRGKGELVGLFRSEPHLPLSLFKANRDDSSFLVGVSSNNKYVCVCLYRRDNGPSGYKDFCSSRCSCQVPGCSVPSRGALSYGPIKSRVGKAGSRMHIT